MKSRILAAATVSLVALSLGGCAVYGPPPAYYGQNQGGYYPSQPVYSQPAPVYAAPAPVYVGPPVSIGLGFGFWGGRHHRY